MGVERIAPSKPLMLASVLGAGVVTDVVILSLMPPLAKKVLQPPSSAGPFGFWSGRLTRLPMPAQNRNLPTSVAQRNPKAKHSVCRLWRQCRLLSNRCCRHPRQFPFSDPEWIFEPKWLSRLVLVDQVKVRSAILDGKIVGLARVVRSHRDKIKSGELNAKSNVSCCYQPG
jgi:hypothetical protein